MRPLTESNALELLTATLQRDYVKDQGELELNFTHPWTAPTLPDAPLSLKILELPTAGVTPSFIVRFQICTANQTLGTWQASVQAHVWRKVWVAHSNLRRGDSIAGADVARERRDILNLHDALAVFADDDSSLELAESVPAGVPLLARMIQARPVIHRGQTANALVQDGALNITLKVQALEDGAPGQIIRARNPVSQRYLSGRVLDANTIQIFL
ncbi:MAG TPA: flagellar basal body P-ring formation chaperone FlgA [Candidatus Sulfopaludibacter sp.]|nr:flagellar basal body P-ring formation chaperone FlgA [Candidatus Sulfopaludibacter sp.]